MNSDTLDCCCCAGKMGEGRHDFMARVGDEIVVVKDVPALICDTCGEVEYTLETSREMDAIIKDFFAGKLLAKPLAAGESTRARANEEVWGSRQSILSRFRIKLRSTDPQESGIQHIIYFSIDKPGLTPYG